MKKMKISAFALCFLLLAAISFTGCGSSSATKNNQQKTSTITDTQQATPVTAKTITGYFFKNNHTISENIDCFVFQDKTSFDNYLGTARTMDKEIEQPNFEKNIVAAIVAKPIDKKTDIVINKAEKTNDGMVNVYFETKAGESISYTMQPLLLFNFAKDEKINMIRFINNSKTIKEIVLKK